jgi:hypothetical protein
VSDTPTESGLRDLDAEEAKLRADEVKFARWAAKQQAEYTKRRQALDARKNALQEEQYRGRLLPLVGVKDDARRNALQEERHRRQLLPLVGVKNGVKIRCRASVWSKDAALNDRLGTLLAVKRTRASVDFGEVKGDARPWEVSLEDLVPAGQEQVWTVAFSLPR